MTRPAHARRSGLRRLLGKRQPSVSPRRRPRLSRTLLVSLLLIGELVALGVKGTMALESSSLTNAKNSASTGTLTLETTPATGTATCQSSGGNVGTPTSDHNTSCGSITITTSPLFPGQSTTTTIRIENSGNLTAGELSVYAPTCTATPTSPANLCTVLEFSIQQTTPSTATACYYPVTTASCPFDSFSTAGGTGTLASFRTKYRVTTRLILGGGVAGLSSRTFALGVELPRFSSPAIGNPYQGATAKLTLTWYLTLTSTVT